MLELRSLQEKDFSMVDQQVFTKPNAKLVTADIDPDNVASRGVLLSCGFTRLHEDSSRYIRRTNEIRAK